MLSYFIVTKHRWPAVANVKFRVLLLHVTCGIVKMQNNVSDDEDDDDDDYEFRSGATVGSEDVQCRLPNTEGRRMCAVYMCVCNCMIFASNVFLFIN